MQIIADVFEVEVNPSSITNTAASGAAIRALNSYFKQREREMIAEGELSSKPSYINTIKPISENVSVYRQMLARYGRLESIAANILNKK